MAPTCTSCRASTTRWRPRSARTARPEDLVASVRHPGSRARAGAPDPDQPHGVPKGPKSCLPPLQLAVRESGHPVVWACDPMHGNTFVSEGGRKTRHFDDVLSEISGFFAACRATGTWPGGVHVELTGDSVTECLGGPRRSSRTTSSCATRRRVTLGSTAASPSTSLIGWPSCSAPARSSARRARRASSPPFRAN